MRILDAEAFAASVKASVAQQEAMNEMTTDEKIAQLKDRKKMAEDSQLQAQQDLFIVEQEMRALVGLDDWTEPLLERRSFASYGATPSVETMVEAISDNGEHRASLDTIVERSNASDDLSGAYVSHQRAFNRPVFDPLRPTANGSDTEEQA